MAKFKWERLNLENKDRSHWKAGYPKNRPRKHRKPLPASAKQILLLSRLGYPDHELKGLTISRASYLIDLSNWNGWKRVPVLVTAEVAEGQREQKDSRNRAASFGKSPRFPVELAPGRHTKRSKPKAER